MKMHQLCWTKQGQDHVHKNSSDMQMLQIPKNSVQQRSQIRQLQRWLRSSMIFWSVFELRGDEAGASSETGDASAALFGAEILGKDQGVDGRTVDMPMDVQQ